MHIDAFLAEFSTFLIGVAIVFTTLVMLVFLIKFLSKIIGSIENKSKPVVKETPVIVSDPVIEAAVDLTDELELVAVITAAIAASMGTTSDRLQVRSLRQVTRQTR
ncbi:MAG: OadG family protein [Cellulosilyticaceae bacterium]